LLDDWLRQLGQLRRADQWDDVQIEMLPVLPDRGSLELLGLGPMQPEIAGGGHRDAR
jgi:hypothetical protein